MLWPCVGTVNRRDVVEHASGACGAATFAVAGCTKGRRGLGDQVVGLGPYGPVADAPTLSRGLRSIGRTSLWSARLALAKSAGGLDIAQRGPSGLALSRIQDNTTR